MINQEQMQYLEKLQRLLPSDNNWRLDRENLRLIDPHGVTLTLTSDEDIGAVTKALYLDSFSTLMNQLSDILDTIRYLQTVHDTTKKELDHYRGHSKKTYNRALEDVEVIVQETPIHSRSARDALNSVINRMQILYDEKRIPAKVEPES